MRVFPQIGGHSRLGFVGLILIFCAIAGVAQSKTAGTQCPRVSVSGDGTHSLGESSFNFVATVTDTDPNQKFSYEWKIYNGTLVEGQGTSTIKVTGKRTLTATVRLTGLPSACVNPTASMSFLEGTPPPPVQLIDEFGSISFQKVKPYLDKLAYHLQNTPGARGSIVSTRKWGLSKRTVEYLSSKHDIRAERILFVNKKSNGPTLIKLYIVPQGATPPN